jgi:glutathione reductase (NADPH)
VAEFDCDLFVIGAGSGGVRAARLAAVSGARVMVAEEYRVGGTCVIRGCVPKKFMVYASEFAHHAKIAEGYGWSPSEARFDWSTFLAAKDQEIARLSGIYVTNLQNAGAELVHDKARLVDAHTVELMKSGRKVTAQRILIATGGRPWKPADLPGVEHVITSDEAFHLDELPKRIVIAGGGFIALEFAGIFNGLGVETTLVHRGPNVLRGFDDHVRAHVAEELERRGIKVLLGARHERVGQTPTGLVSHLSTGAAIESDVVMFATGREPYVEGLNLEAAGVAVTETGAIAVDDYSRTNVPSIWAVGDVTDRINLTPVAIREGHAFADTVFGGRPTRPDHALVPSAVFTQPEFGTIGLTEEAAREQGPIEVYATAFRPMRSAFAGHPGRVMMKLIVSAETRRVLGCHIVAPDAGEMIQLVAIAMKMGATKEDFDRAVAVHPTMAEELVTMRKPVRKA